MLSKLNDIMYYIRNEVDKGAGQSALLLHTRSPAFIDSALSMLRMPACLHSGPNPSSITSCNCRLQPITGNRRREGATRRTSIHSAARF